MPFPSRFLARRLVTRVPLCESNVGAVLDLQTGQRSNSDTRNLRGLVTENVSRYTDEIPPGDYVLGGNANAPAGFGHRFWYFIGGKLFGADACEVVLEIGFQLAPGDPVRRLYLLGPFADSKAWVGSVLFPPAAHRWRLIWTYQTTSGGLAGSNNALRVSSAFRARTDLVT